MNTPDPSAAILLGGSGSCLSVARSLKQSGIAVTVLGGADSPVARSRACFRYVDIGSGQAGQERSLQWLSKNATTAVVLPCGDDGLELIARHRDELLELGYRPTEARDEMLLAMLDKERTYELCQQVGIDCPDTITIHTEADLNKACETMAFPWALKPLSSHLSARHFTQKLFLVRDPDEARSQVAFFRDLRLQILATEIIEGWDDQYMSYYTYIDATATHYFTSLSTSSADSQFTLGCGATKSRSGCRMLLTSDYDFAGMWGCGGWLISNSNEMPEMGA